MVIAWRSWWDRTVLRRIRSSRPRLEWLENRILFAGDTLATATLLSPKAGEPAHVSGFLALPNQIDIYEVHLGRGDRIAAGVSTRAAGGGLLSVLRVFDGDGTPLALDDRLGGD